MYVELHCLMEKFQIFINLYMAWRCYSKIPRTWLCMISFNMYLELDMKYDSISVDISTLHHNQSSQLRFSKFYISIHVFQIRVTLYNVRFFILLGYMMSWLRLDSIYTIYILTSIHCHSWFGFNEQFIGNILNSMLSHL